MAAAPFALSVHNFISSVGADAGFASVIGLAILSLLYFAHARETANLREEAANLAQRLQEAEASLADARAEAVVAEARPPSAPSVTSTGGVGARLLAPMAPAGMAAPALAAATRFIPAVRLDPQPPSPPRPVTVPAVAPAPAVFAGPSSTAPPAPAYPAGGEPSPAPMPVGAGASVEAPAPEALGGRDEEAEDSASARPAPATVAGAANGASSVRPRAPEGEPRVLAAPPRFTPPPRSAFITQPAARRSSPAGRRFFMLVGILLLIGAAAAAVIVTSGTGNSGSPSKTPASNAPSPRASAFDPSHVTVAVLNGTATNQLAHHIAARLSGLGYQKGVIATASNQTLRSTIVAYLPGPSNRADALHVAAALHLGRRAVSPINQAAQAVACPPPGTCTANVVVTVGADLAGA